MCLRFARISVCSCSMESLLRKFRNFPVRHSLEGCFALKLVKKPLAYPVVIHLHKVNGGNIT